MRRANIFFTVLLFLTASAPALAASADRLSWAPPPQTHPTKIDIRYDENDASKIQIVKNAYPYDHPGTSAQDMNMRVTIKLGDDEDAVIELPRKGILALPGLGINNGRNVRLIGGHLAAIAPADQSLRGLLRFAGQSGSVFVEGVVVDARHQYGLDGILVGGVRHKPGIVADIYIQNCLIEGISSTRSGLHADGFQYYGSTKWTHMDRVSIVSQYQGLFLDPQADMDGIDLRHVDVDYEDAATGMGYIFFLRHEANMKRHPAVRLEDVYAGTRTNKLPWEEYSIYPPASRTVGAVLQGDRATFPAFPEVKGYVTRGKPPGGPWVDAKNIGAGYVSPGYLDAN